MYWFTLLVLKSIWNFHWSKILLQRYVNSTIFHFDLTNTTSTVGKLRINVIKWDFLVWFSNHCGLHFLCTFQHERQRRRFWTTFEIQSLEIQKETEMHLRFLNQHIAMDFLYKSCQNWGAAAADSGMPRRLHHPQTFT